METLPTFLEHGLNDDLRRAIKYMESLQPIDTFKAWKERALQQGNNLEAARRKDRKPTTNNPASGRGASERGTSYRGPNNPTSTTPISAAAAAATTPKERNPQATQGLVPQKERDRRMAAGDCFKCGKAAHIGKNCRTGWRNDPAVVATTPATPAAATTATPEIKIIERSRNRKRKQRDQAANNSGKD